jgi:hypothetical protein
MTDELDPQWEVFPDARIRMREGGLDLLAEHLEDGTFLFLGTPRVTRVGNDIYFEIPVNVGKHGYIKYLSMEVNIPMPTQIRARVRAEDCLVEDLGAAADILAWHAPIITAEPDAQPLPDIDVDINAFSIPVSNLTLKVTVDPDRDIHWVEVIVTKTGRRAYAIELDCVMGQYVETPSKYQKLLQNNLERLLAHPLLERLDVLGDGSPSLDGGVK